jgi:hypothetical protein
VDSKARMSVRRSLIPLALAACASAAALSCVDPSPVGVDLQAPALPEAARRTLPATKGSGLVPCAQTYDSVTQVIGPVGGLIAVGRHILWVDSMALSDTVRITAVAPADTVRWVRFRPDGLRFRTNGAGWSALLYTSFKDCGVPTRDTLRIAQVTDSLAVIRYLAPPDSTWIKVRKKAWSKGNQYVAGVLHHFSQYAVSW